MSICKKQKNKKNNKKQKHKKTENNNPHIKWPKFIAAGGRFSAGNGVADEFLEFAMSVPIPFPVDHHPGDKMEFWPQLIGLHASLSQ